MQRHELDGGISSISGLGKFFRFLFFSETRGIGRVWGRSRSLRRICVHEADDISHNSEKSTRSEACRRIRSPGQHKSDAATLTRSPRLRHLKTSQGHQDDGSRYLLHCLARSSLEKPPESGKVTIKWARSNPQLLLIRVYDVGLNCAWSLGFGFGV